MRGMMLKWNTIELVFTVCLGYDDGLDCEYDFMYSYK